MLVLGIESSCDETAAAVVQDGRIMRSNVVSSQIDVHSRYGGIVPEIASRKHIEAIAPAVCQALEDAGVALGAIEGIAVTQGPGLVGSLLVGLSTAKAIAFARGIPFVGVNHLEGHVAAVLLEDRTPEFPFTALVVSGGHTSIYRVRDLGHFELLGQTRDDAAGEAFDKAAKLLDIGYPGGIVIDRLARAGNRDWLAFPRAMKDSLDFSFSGLKTSLLINLKKRGCPYSEGELPHVAASYQEAIVDVLVEKTLRAAGNSGLSRIVVCGGVAANSRLRERFREECDRCGFEIYIPRPALCTDNAAMIAVAGTYLLERGESGSLEMNAYSRLPAGMPA
ncbi:MAG: tRNA (adenosine(37)-N6)-threonylcarbamoyltransferase complex transferase subunit TsaD [Deltaproteobacteria bacterium]|nr:tRNA (adenosine(37)-N6)-threonylcarbamoyltransferase complex transferase subunit TsaD [Deltaproteobacteria bacterium]